MAIQLIKYSSGMLEIIDQFLLPMQRKYVPVYGVEDGWNVINRMQVRGASAIAIVGCLSLAVEIYGEVYDCKQILRQEVEGKLNYLASARTTAMNLWSAVDNLIGLANELARDKTINIHQMKKLILERIESMLQKNTDDNMAIGVNGAKAILSRSCHNNGPISILTHCNTGFLATAGYGTTLSVLRKLNELQQLEHVYCTESHPYIQSACLSTHNLGKDELPSTMIILDNSITTMLRSKNIAAVIVGADMVAANGDTVNRPGTYEIAVAAKEHKVPFYVAAPLASVNTHIPTGHHIIIEESSYCQMAYIGDDQIASTGIKCWNSIFDVTPAPLITGLITEYGVYDPWNLKQEVQRRTTPK